MAMAMEIATKQTHRKCDVCKLSTKVDEVSLFGDWMQTNSIQVHYFCLLLSTNLNQNGKDFSGIGGFLVRDIRKEIKDAEMRSCCYCNNQHASIRCNNCMEFFHLVCGRLENCLFQFDGYFQSYCNKCLIMIATPFEKQLIENPPPAHTRCSICCETLGKYNPTIWIYGRCCGNGFAHRICLQGYASSAGYYLRCIWCRSEKFRSLIRLQGIFVPDRDATWEREPGAYRDLHRSTQKCNMPECLCPQGSDFISRKWPLTKCVLCGSVGAHNPYCITGNMKSSTPIENYKCEVCLKTEQSVAADKTSINETHEENDEDNLNLDRTLFMTKISKRTSIGSIEKEKPMEIQIMDVDSSQKQDERNYLGIYSDKTIRMHAVDVDNWKTLKKGNHVEAVLKIWGQLKDGDNANANLIAIKGYTFEEKKKVLQCTGTATVCVNSGDMSNITSNNIIAWSDDKGKFNVIDKTIEDFKEDNNL